MRRLTSAVACQTVAALATLSLLGACGGSAEPDPVAPIAWWKSVCGAVKPWSAEIGKLQGEAKQKVSNKSDAEASKTQLVTLFGGSTTLATGAIALVDR